MEARFECRHARWYGTHDATARTRGDDEEQAGIRTLIEAALSTARAQARAEYQAEIAALKQECDVLGQEIADAREACPLVRQQEYFEAPLMTLVEQEIRQLLAMQSRAEQAEAAVTQARAEVLEEVEQICEDIVLQYGERYQGQAAEELQSRIVALRTHAPEAQPKDDPL